MPTPEEIANAQVQPAPGMPVLEPTDPSVETGRVLPADPPAQPLTDADRQAMAAIPGVDRTALSGMAPVSAPPTQAAPATKYVSAPKAQDPFAVVATRPGATTSSTARTELGPKGTEAQKAADKAFETQGKAVDTVAAAAQERAKVDAEAAAARAKIAAQYDAQAQQQALAAKTAVDAKLADYSKSQEEFTQATNELDADRFWHRQGTGQRIGNIISIALSGLGQMLIARGGGGQTRNQALDMINLAVDRDIDMQKTALAAKERGVRVKESAYSVARAAGADEAQAIALARAQSLQRVDMEFQAKAAQIGTQDALAKAQEAHAQIEAQRAAQLQRVAEIEATHVQTATTSQPIVAAQLQAQQAQAEGLVPKDPKLATPYGQAPDQETRRIMLKEGGGLKSFEGNVSKLDTLAKAGWMSRKLSPAEQQKWDSAVAGVTAYIAGPDMANAGASLTPDEYKLKIEPYLPGGSAWASGSGKDASAIKGLQDVIDLKRKAIQAYAVRTSL
jgi:hypothetical protein